MSWTNIAISWDIAMKCFLHVSLHNCTYYNSKLLQVTTPLLKFMAEFVLNKAQRLTFDSSSANGILLFREVSKLVVAYGSRILSHPINTDVYANKYKGIWISLTILTRGESMIYIFIDNNGVNFICVITRCFTVSHWLIFWCCLLMFILTTSSTFIIMHNSFLTSTNLLGKVVQSGVKFVIIIRTLMIKPSFLQYTIQKGAPQCNNML